jgi:hypothetical protein
LNCDYKALPGPNRALFYEAHLSNAIDEGKLQSSPSSVLSFFRNYSKMATTLAPLPQPGLVLFQGFTATKPETFLAKDLNTFAQQSSCSIFFCSPTGEPSAQFLDIVEGPKDHISFRTTNGQEVMRILKKASAWQWKSNEYTGMRVDGTVVWHLKLRKGWTSSDYGKFLVFLLCSRTTC